MIKTLAIGLIAASVLTPGAGAAASDGPWLMREIARAKANSILDIPAGAYDLTDVKIAKSLTLRGAADGTTVFRSAEVTEKGILVPQSGVDLTVENITFEGARSWDRNGAGIRHEGRNLTIVNCRFINNDDGVLSTGSPAGEITITTSSFTGNGFGDGQSHAIYVVDAAKLAITESSFIGTRIGHHVKSLAAVTTISRSNFDDEHGRTSYSVDASKGGDVTIIDNTFIQAADADNSAILNYDLTRGGKAGALIISANTITNFFNGGVLLRNDTRTAPVMSGNTVLNRGGQDLRMVSKGSPSPISN
ncbi:MAG: right-handed parallel beta-helix repeat-containing protein [Parvularculaceae bacterium]